MKRFISNAFGGCLLIALSWSICAQPGYYRSPTMHGQTIVFTAEGDLWRLSLADNQAVRLTTHPAEEHSAVISPDGQQLAFTANYEGAIEVYVMPLSGGLPKRVTYENSLTKLHGWHADGGILYASISQAGKAGSWVLRQVDPATLISGTIPLADAVEGDKSNNNTLIFVQHGLQSSYDNANRYMGGAKGELWKYSLESGQEAVKLTTKHKGSVRTPMVSAEVIYFVSNQSGLDNIWSMSLNGKNIKQITDFTDWAVREPSLHDNRIIFQHGADLKILSLDSGEIQTVPIQLVSDFPQLRENWVNEPMKQLTSARFTGQQKKVALTARGRVALAGITKSRLVEIATEASSRTRQAILSHDGKWVYALNDASGETEIWQFSADGVSEAKQLTSDGSTMRWNIYPSPDGQWLAHDDKNGNLWLLNLATGDNQKILDGLVGVNPIATLNWSGNSDMLAISYMPIDAERSTILLYSVKEAKYEVITSAKYESFSPVFSADNQWLYFLSNRVFQATPTSPWGDRNMGPVFDRRTNIYAISLHEEAKFPFQTPNELLEAQALNEPEETKTSDSEKDEKEQKPTTELASTKIQWQGIAQRLWKVPVSSGNYRHLGATDKHLYVLDRKSTANAKAQLKSIAIKPETKLETFTNNVAAYELSSDGKQIFVRKQGKDNSELFIVDAGPKFPKDVAKQKVQTAQWKLAINPQQEWQQIFKDAWLMHRDSLFDQDMRGLDWQATREKYLPLLMRVTDRHELNDIFKQMMGELNTLHSQVWGGDAPRDKDAPSAANLGAVFTETAEGLRIAHIYQTDPELPEQAGPLRQAGVDAKVGDLIITLNGQAIPNKAALVSQLRNQAGKQILLTLERQGKTIKTVVTPVSARAAAQLRYQDWTLNNLQQVTSADNKIGYLHLYAMGSRDIAHFAREFYAQYDKPALIIDVRGNRGGNIDAWILEKLLKRTWSFWQLTSGKPSTNMQQTFRGHLVVLADEFTYSDGETFTAGIKALELGTVIGKQTAGAGVWLSGRNRVVDGGIARVAEYPVFDLEGHFIVEGNGVKPHIEVDNLPHATFNGHDAQLKAAIAHLQKKMRQQPVKPLKAKPFPANMQPAKTM